MAKATAKKVVKRRRERKNVEKGAVHIRSSFNNTMVTICMCRWVFSVPRSISKT